MGAVAAIRDGITLAGVFRIPRTAFWAISINVRCYVAAAAAPIESKREILTLPVVVRLY